MEIPWQLHYKIIKDLKTSHRSVFLINQDKKLISEKLSQITEDIAIGFHKFCDRQLSLEYIKNEDKYLWKGRYFTPKELFNEYLKTLP